MNWLCLNRSRPLIAAQLTGLPGHGAFVNHAVQQGRLAASGNAAQDGQSFGGNVQIEAIEIVNRGRTDSDIPGPGLGLGGRNSEFVTGRAGFSLPIDRT